jgi:hypothetical protein
MERYNNFQTEGEKYKKTLHLNNQNQHKEKTEDKDVATINVT